MEAERAEPSISFPAEWTDWQIADWRDQWEKLLQIQGRVVQFKRKEIWCPCEVDAALSQAFQENAERVSISLSPCGKFAGIGSSAGYLHPVTGKIVPIEYDSILPNLVIHYQIPVETQQAAQG